MVVTVAVEYVGTGNRLRVVGERGKQERKRERICRAAAGREPSECKVRKQMEIARLAGDKQKECVPPTDVIRDGRSLLAFAIAGSHPQGKGS